MGYYNSKTIKGRYKDVVEKTKGLLREEGFGIITSIDLKETLKQKLEVEYKNYTILGACDPKLAVRALQSDDKIGALLPCNVLVIDQGNESIEVAFIDVEDSLGKLNNPELNILAREVNNTFNRVLQKL
ncbi:MAG: DUF302 domain-containing protein [Chlorobi bacterium]|nr:DUF302 domain-containing protein [Chlorobiota bacterium]